MRYATLMLCAAALAGCMTNAGRADARQCYDLRLWAEPTAQIPTPLPDYDGIIVMSWPWFIDLKVLKVIDGVWKDQNLSAVAIRHVGYSDEAQAWFLRENTIGGYNVLRLEKPNEVKRCSIGSVKAEPYLQPSEGETVEGLRAESEAEWAELMGNDER